MQYSSGIRLTCVTATWNIISAGNRESLIRCVKSVAELKIDHEHLIYDGASTDGTVELLHKLEKETPGLKVVSEKDTGIYNALNKGVRDAKGKWFYVLGSDDYICNPSAMVDAIKKLEAEHASVVVSPVQMESGRVHRVRLRWRMIYMPYSHQGMITSLEAIRKGGGFDENYRISADADLSIRLQLAGYKVVVYNRIYAWFGETGISRADMQQTRFETTTSLARAFRLSEDERRDLHWRRIMPIRVSLRYLFHRDVFVRVSAWWQLSRNIVDWVGLLDDQGRLRV